MRIEDNLRVRMAATQVLNQINLDYGATGAFIKATGAIRLR